MKERYGKDYYARMGKKGAAIRWGNRLNAQAQESLEGGGTYGDKAEDTNARLKGGGQAQRD